MRITNSSRYKNFHLFFLNISRSYPSFLQFGQKNFGETYFHSNDFYFLSKCQGFLTYYTHIIFYHDYKILLLCFNKLNKWNKNRNLLFLQTLHKKVLSIVSSFPPNDFVPFKLINSPFYAYNIKNLLLKQLTTRFYRPHISQNKCLRVFELY